MHFAEASTYNDLLELFVGVNDKIARLRDRLGCPDVDARQVALGGIQRVVAGYFMGLHALVYERSESQILRSLGPSGLAPAEARKTVEDAWRWGLLALCHFRIDTLLHNTLRALGHGASKSFARKAGDLVALLSLADQPKVETALMTLTHLRNSLHNNGIHRQPSATLAIGGMTYSFVQNGAVQCADWQHVLCALDGACDALESILLAPLVAGIPPVMVDDFVTELAAGRAQE